MSVGSTQCSAVPNTCHLQNNPCAFLAALFHWFQVATGTKIFRLTARCEISSGWFVGRDVAFHGALGGEPFSSAIVSQQN